MLGEYWWLESNWWGRGGRDNTGEDRVDPEEMLKNARPCSGSDCAISKLSLSVDRASSCLGFLLP